MSVSKISTPRSPVPPAGLYAPLVTFFNPDFSLDIPSIEAHALRIAQGGVAGLVIQGSNGEAVHLDNEERSTIVRKIRAVLDTNGFKNIKLIVGIGAQSQIATVKLAKEAKESGGDFGLCLPPSYWASAMSKSVLMDFFKSVADESPIPILIYNFPLVANGINIDSDTMLELAQHSNIVGCKLTCGNIGNLHRICAHTNSEEFCTLAGKAEFLLHSLVGGSSGCIGALVNLAPKVHVALYNAYKAGDLPLAKHYQDILGDADLAQQKLGVAGLKLAVSKYFGYGTGLARSPLPNGDEGKLRAQSEPLARLVDLEKSL